MNTSKFVVFFSLICVQNTYHHCVKDFTFSVGDVCLGCLLMIHRCFTSATLISLKSVLWEATDKGRGNTLFNYVCTATQRWWKNIAKVCRPFCLVAKLTKVRQQHQLSDYIAIYLLKTSGILLRMVFQTGNLNCISGGISAAESIPMNNRK